MDELLQWALTMPIWVTAAALIGLGSLVTAMGILAVNQVWTPLELAENNNVGGFKFAFLGQVVSALLGFVLLEAGTSYIGAQAHVRNEVSALRQIAVLTGEMDRAVARPLMLAQQRYVLSVVEQEWPAMARAGEAEETTATLRGFYTAFLSEQIPAGRDRALAELALPYLDRVVDARAARIGDASEDLAGLIWFAIIVGVSVSVGYTWFFGSNLLAPQVMMGMLLVSAIMALVVLAIVLGHPFAGDLAISDRGYWQVLRDLQRQLGPVP